jgi:hypothetical protein
MPPRKAERVFQVKESFFAEDYGLVSRGELFAESHPLIRRYRESFDAVEDRLRPSVEQTTAGPGELRGEPMSAPSSSLSGGP